MGLLGNTRRDHVAGHEQALGRRSPASRAPARGLGPAPPFLGPLADRFRVGACRAAQPGDSLRLGHVLRALALGRAEPRARRPRPAGRRGLPPARAVPPRPRLPAHRPARPTGRAARQCRRAVRRESGQPARRLSTMHSSIAAQLPPKLWRYGVCKSGSPSERRSSSSVVPARSWDRLSRSAAATRISVFVVIRSPAPPRFLFSTRARMDRLVI